MFFKCPSQPKQNKQVHHGALFLQNAFFKYLAVASIYRHINRKVLKSCFFFLFFLPFVPVSKISNFWSNGISAHVYTDTEKLRPSLSSQCLNPRQPTRIPLTNFPPNLFVRWESFVSQSPKETCPESLGAIYVRILIYQTWPMSETFRSTVRFWSLINNVSDFVDNPQAIWVPFVLFSITFQADALCTGALLTTSHGSSCIKAYRFKSSRNLSRMESTLQVRSNGAPSFQVALIVIF